MEQKPIDIRADKIAIKGASLMGPRSGLPTSVESDKDGKITRIRPYYYDKDFEWESLNPWKIEAKGRTFEPPRHSVPAAFYLSYKKRVYSENRVKYPLKRVDWDPNGERNTQNRGKSRYVRISWDEAAQIIADELLRVRAEYGMSCVLAEADMHGEGKHMAPSHGCMNRLLSLLGGYTVQMRNQDSWEGYSWGSKNVWGGEPVGEMQPSGNLWPDIAKNAELLLLWGADPEVTPVGFDGYMASRLSQWIHSLGIKYTYVDPALNYSGCYQADKWIPILPNTDAALLLAIAYVWLTEDAYDKAYVETHAIGYQEFFDYVLGKEDGEPKTAKWASEKCGVPPWTIKALARDWATKITSFTIGNGGPGIRGPFATEPARLQSILMGMQGIGKPGQHHAKWLEWNLHTDTFPMPHQPQGKFEIPHRAEIVRPPSAQADYIVGDLITDSRVASKEAEFYKVGREDGRYRVTANAKKVPELAELLKILEIPPQQSIPKCLVHDAILDGKTDWWGLYSFCGPAEEQWEHHIYPAPGCSRIHMIWTDSPCMVTCWNDGFRIVKAFRDPSVECIVAQQPWLENDCILADIVLPVQTKFELEDICEDNGSGVISCAYHEQPACPPVGESLDDFDCVAEVARKLGEDIYNAYTGNKMPKEKVLELFYQGSGIVPLDPNDDFHKKGIVVFPCVPDIQDFEKYPPGLRTFADDPEAHPLTTPSGKLEFTSTKIQECFPDDKERPPFPKWIEKSPLHDERLTGERAKKYPLLCMSNHGRWRFHANLDDVTWHREVETMKIRGKDGYQYEAAWINPKTAAERNIAYGDVVKVFNERGVVLCAAYVTERLMEQVVYVDHGARFDPVDAENLDRGGAINLITPTAITSKTVTGMVVSGFLVEVQKVTDAEMESWKKQFPDSFGRKVDEGCGVCLDGWLIDEQRAGGEANV
ncbi:MAG: molybdopterin-dependent oxidoreductase [Clostridiales Family XIII bacterium]|jgi:trimethylamine-N-oxide reductase (cytochrome c)|nr:molybdopterin-dependent oxidoreductase [Clostridiales Family XIII bacterium]